MNKIEAQSAVRNRASVHVWTGKDSYLMIAVGWSDVTGLITVKHWGNENTLDVSPLACEFPTSI